MNLEHTYVIHIMKCIKEVILGKYVNQVPSRTAYTSPSEKNPESHVTLRQVIYRHQNGGYCVTENTAIIPINTSCCNVDKSFVLNSAFSLFMRDHITRRCPVSFTANKFLWSTT